MWINESCECSFIDSRKESIGQGRLEAIVAFYLSYRKVKININLQRMKTYFIAINLILNLLIMSI